MKDCCPWDRALFSYHGLRSHSALADGMIGGILDLSAEQLEAMAAAVKEQVRKNQSSSEANIKASKKSFCKPCGVSCTSNWELERHNNSKRHLEKVARQRRNAPAKKKSYSALSQARAKAVKKYFCTTCNVTCPSQWELDRHNGSKRHLQKVAKAQPSVSSA